MIRAIALLISLVGHGLQAQFSDPQIGMSFNYPEGWSKTAAKSGTILTFSPEPGEQAVLQIFAADFRADAEIWQNAQKAIVGQLHQELLLQTQEELLGVPLLLTKSRMAADIGGRLVLSGLIYSATPKKMLFRLTASANAFDSAERQWREVLQTLRTLDGKLPESETPGRNPEVIPIGKEPIKRPLPAVIKKPPTRIDKKKGGTVAITKLVEVDGRCGEVKLKLNIPLGWQAITKDDGSVTLSNKSFPSGITVSFSKVADLLPGKALIMSSAKSLEDFVAVGRREDFGPAENLVAAVVMTAWRIGTDKVGERVSFDAVGMTGDYFWTIAWAKTGRPAGEKKVINDLVQQMKVTVAQ